jgi:hypothetical protein
VDPAACFRALGRGVFRALGKDGRDEWLETVESGNVSEEEARKERERLCEKGELGECVGE